MTFEHDGEPCTKCKTGKYYWSKHCGCYVCDKCGDHKGLSCCYCGWNIHLADPVAMYLEGW